MGRYIGAKTGFVLEVDCASSPSGNDALIVNAGATKITFGKITTSHVDPAAGITAAQLNAFKYFFFGTGADGAITINGGAAPTGFHKTDATHYEITSERAFTDVTITTGIYIDVNGYRFTGHTLTVGSGVVINSDGANGADASGSTPGAGGAGGAGSNTITRGTAGAVGGAGNTGSGAGSNGNNGSAESNSRGGNGGAGGGGGAGGTGGTGATSTAAKTNPFGHGIAAWQQKDQTSAYALMKGGSIGGSGAGGGGGSGLSGGDGGGGGASGDSGGGVVVAFDTIDITNWGSGRISANGGKGGNGANGAAGGAISGGGGGGGGGGGSGGGLVSVMARVVTGGTLVAGTNVTATGGLGGTKGTGGANGSGGPGAGSNGVDGSAGTDGSIIIIVG